MTYGEKAVGLDFNPSGDPNVERSRNPSEGRRRIKLPDWGRVPRQRGYHPGDVQSDGSICTGHGYAMRYADIWVGKRQSERAEKFGWRVIGRRRNLVLVRGP